MFWEHREDTEPAPPQCDVSQIRKPLIFQEPLCKGSKQNTENNVMTDPSGVNGLRKFFFPEQLIKGISEEPSKLKTC